jgi:hypothetical protein
MNRFVAIRIQIACCAQGEGALTHLSRTCQYRKGNLVSRRHTDCLDLDYGRSTECVLSPLNIRARDNDNNEAEQILCLLIRKKLLMAQVFTMRRIAFVACSHTGCGYMPQKICATFQRRSCVRRVVICRMKYRLPSGQTGIAQAPRNSLTKTAIRFLLLLSHISYAILPISSP